MTGGEGIGLSPRRRKRPQQARGPAGKPGLSTRGYVGVLLGKELILPSHIMPPMSGIPPPGMPAPSFSGGSATMHSVVRMFLAIDAAF
jgi:hypothetical protein